MQDCKVNILGTEYKIKIKKYDEEPRFKERSIDGFHDEDLKLIVILDMSTHPDFKNESEEKINSCMKSILRHEIIHGFFSQSGLSFSANVFNGSWCNNEEMVDWIAIQSPKMFKVFQELDIL